MKTLILLSCLFLLATSVQAFPEKEIREAHQLVTCLRTDSAMLGIFLQSMVEIRKITGTGNEYHNILVLVLSGALDKLYPAKTNAYINSVIKKCVNSSIG